MAQAKSPHHAAWRKYREGKLEGESAHRLMKAVVTEVFPERQRAVAGWRKELFALYRKGQRVSDFVDAGMAYDFLDDKGAKEVKSERQMLDHVCWDVSGGFIAIDPEFP